MSISTLLGMIMGFGLFLGSIILSTNNYWSFLSLPSFLMVFGGTMAAAFVSFQGRYVWLALHAIKEMFQKPDATREGLNKEILQLIRWAYLVQKKGLVALENEGGAVDAKNHPILKFGVDLVATGYKPEEIRSMLETAVDAQYERNAVPVVVLKNMGANAPAFGMIGTLVGLIIMLQSLGEDLSTLGLGLAVALLTTLYGVVLARLVFLPAAFKMEQREDIRRFRNDLVTEGLVLLSDKQTPRFMQDKLNSFLDPSIHFDIDKQI